MNPRKPARQLLLSIAIATAAFAGSAAAQVSLNILVAPPAPRHEVMPQVPAGHVWAPGYWGWNGDRHVWVRGRPILQRDGYVWTPYRWDQRDRGYTRTAGHWVRDPGYRGRGHDDERHRFSDDKGKGNHGQGNKGRRD